MARPRNSENPVNPGNSRSTQITVMSSGEPTPVALPTEESVMPTRDMNMILNGEPEQFPVDPTAPSTPSDPTGAPVQAGTPDADEIDDPRLKGKSRKELAEILRNQEQMIGRQAEEVGTYRRHLDKFILSGSQPAPAATPAEQPAPTGEDEATLLNEMLTSPKQFLARAKREALNEIAAVATKHQTAKLYEHNREVVESPEFRQWLVANVPQHIAQSADNGDIQSYNFILNAYRATSSNRQEPVSAPNPTSAKPAAQPSAQVASAPAARPVGSAAGIPAAGAPQGSSKPIFTRLQLAKMMDTGEYAQRQAEIMEAYREGRVR